MTSNYFTSIEEALAAIGGSGIFPVGTERVFGGDINEAYHLTLSDGRHIFLKANERKDVSFFEAEARGLEAISATGAVGTPSVLGYGIHAGKPGNSFLLLEFLRGGRRMPDYWETLGHQLADMHRAGTEDYVNGGKYGFLRDNYIGGSRQLNTPHASWISFFRDCRLEPQFRHAARYFNDGDFRKITRLLDHMEDFLAEPEYPSFLHGDLWAGNVMTGNDGRAWLIDPAAYVGHAEADIAMTELFGGFPAAFYDAYREAGLLPRDYKERRGLYNLYHLLNHLNLFGGGYLSSVRQTLGRYVS